MLLGLLTSRPKFLHTHAKLANSNKRCCCTSKHVKVEGALTKSSATYVPALAHAFALDFKDAIDAARARRDVELEIDGLENQAVNHMALSLQWEVSSSWTSKRPSHINLLEARCVESLLESEIKSLRGDRRIVSLTDSNVARCALAKGRSSSYALSSVLRRIGSLMIAGGLYRCTPYVPTRLNVADDPTRDQRLRLKVGDFGGWSREKFMDLALCRPLRRWCSNWLRLVLVALEFTLAPSARDLPHRRACFTIEFDRTLGFPGEGPWISSLALSPGFASSFVVLGLSLLHAFPGRPALLRPPCRSVFFLLVFFVSSPGAGVLAMESGPRNAGDLVRIQNRLELGPLPEGLWFWR